MAIKPTVILASGGLRSLVALAVAASAHDRPRVAALHFKDGRECARARLDHLRRQADHYRLDQTLEIELPHLQSQDTGKGRSWGSLVRAQILLTGLAQAIESGAARLIWPAQVNGELDAMARLTEQVELALHLAQLEHEEVPAIETPLLELTDRQMIELGAQVDAPWELAWTCLLPSPMPCRQCAGCRRRRAAFAAAGVTDSQERTGAAARGSTDVSHAITGVQPRHVG